MPVPTGYVSMQLDANLCFIIIFIFIKKIKIREVTPEKRKRGFFW